ncbi:S8 family peptidase [Enterococcus hirae]|uniref:S8 family peptidase n=1 Tax=Enterococcus TaxID=1350 RepID=UPI00159A0F2F|nr:S8 family peptidase [Enterococcus hirae]EMF0260295.1 S8 family peptidase [Enterococcus hirae]MBA5272342.1 S8 family peptidase [Enterococcus hirae]MDU1933302.1 S8 family peptidase [Enterococcus hirae]QKX70722.1 S8 family peptidase [Enterococcus hirae]
MNDILNLKGRFEQKPSKQRPGSPKLPKNTTVTSNNIEILVNDLVGVEQFWKTQTLINGCLISVRYKKIAAKSNRIQGFLSKGSKTPNISIVGAKFSSKKNKHIITHFVSLKTISETINYGKICINILEKEFKGSLNDKIFNAPRSVDHIKFKEYGISKTKFQKIIVDAAYTEKFDVPKGEFDVNKSSIVTLYETGNDTKELLSKLNIPIYDERIINDTTILLDEDYLKILLQKAPYLVSMATENISELAPNDFSNIVDTSKNKIPLPIEEPVVGVIDTLFDESTYFSSWVEFHNMVDENIPLNEEDYKHGTAVSSIIVDGPNLNPNLDDGCGRFKVRHFGVATNKAFNSFSIIRSIKEIIMTNRDIHVWNLSLGSNDEVNENFISAEAAVLDQIQFDYDVIFVIAGTNKKRDENDKRIGAPADSINSVVVNSVSISKEPALYSRKGIVLSFFTKPDVSYYGGDRDNPLIACEPLGNACVSGTSYAAPWIARKLAYLIEIIGLTKEVAKALLIDSAIGWSDDKSFEELATVGHGIVPVRIEDIIKAPDDEIKFLVSDVSQKYDTFNYQFPVPIYKDKHPYIAKATMCYFPKCSRNQGVDYTNTELDIYFGRIKDNGALESINKNNQSVENETHYLTEESARKMFRKWDNIKHVSEGIKRNPKGKKVYENNMWGMSIKTKERLNPRDGEGIRFGVVVTLKEINGVNRIDEFIQRCSLRGWLVDRVNVENRIDIYQTANETIELE